MPSTYPYVVGSPILRTCRRCRSRVPKDSMSPDQPRICLTCCEIKLPPASGHVFREDGTCRCGKKAPKAAPKPDAPVSQNHITKPGDASGLYDYEEAEIEENERWRTA